MQVGRVTASGTWLTALAFASHSAAQPGSAWLGLVASDADGRTVAFDVDLQQCTTIAGQQGQAASELPAMGRLLTSRGVIMIANGRGTHALSVHTMKGPAAGMCPYSLHSKAWLPNLAETSEKQLHDKRMQLS